MEHLTEPSSRWTRECRWDTPGRSPDLSPGALHVWRADLDAPAAELSGLLDGTELARAARILDERRRLRWGRARDILRALLGGYLGVDPRVVSIDHAPNGKPTLVPRGPNADMLFFNISHSGPLALLAFTRAGEVGVDLELPRSRTTDVAALAGRVFGAAEERRLRALPEPGREREFLRGWVRHEALIKQSAPSGGPGERAGARRGDGPGPSQWLAELSPGGDGVAAVALSGTPSELRCWEW